MRARTVDRLPPLPPRLHARAARRRRRDVLARGRSRSARAGNAAEASSTAGRAAALARQIVDTAPDRAPGSEGDSAVADLVAHRFGEIPTGAVSEQRFDATYERRRRRAAQRRADPAGRRPTRRSSSSRPATLRGARRPRRARPRPGSWSSSRTRSGSATALTYVLASVSGSEAGAAGVRAAGRRACPTRDSIDGIVVISQPGAARAPRQPFVVSSSTGHRDRVGPAGARPRALAVAQQAGRARRRVRGPDPARPPRVPVRPRRPGAADRRRASTRSRSPRPASGRSTRATIRSTTSRRARSTPSAAPSSRRSGRSTSRRRAPVHGPRDLRAARQQPDPGLGAGGAGAGADPARRRRRRRLCAPALRAAAWRSSRRSIWAPACSLPFVGALAVLYALALVGARSAPAVPVRPRPLRARRPRGDHVRADARRRRRGERPVLLRRRNITASAAPPSGASRPAGRSRSAACVAVWLANPYLALLAGARGARLAARPRGRLGAARGRAPRAAALLASSRSPPAWPRSPPPSISGAGAVDVHADGRRRPDRPARGRCWLPARWRRSPGARRARSPGRQIRGDLRPDRPAS